MIANLQESEKVCVSVCWCVSVLVSFHWRSVVGTCVIFYFHCRYSKYIDAITTFQIYS